VSEVIRLSLDTEFMTYYTPKGVGLISMGIVPIDDTSLPNFYEVRDTFKKPIVQREKFLKKEVIPKLFLPPFEDTKPLTGAQFRSSLARYFYEVARSVDSPASMQVWVKSGKKDLEILKRRITDRVANRIIKRTAINFLTFHDIHDLPDVRGMTYLTKPEIDKHKKHNSYFDAEHQASYIRWVEANLSATCTEKLAMDAFAKSTVNSKASKYKATGIPVADKCSSIFCAPK